MESDESQRHSFDVLDRLATGALQGARSSACLTPFNLWHGAFSTYSVFYFFICFTICFYI